MHDDSIIAFAGNEAVPGLDDGGHGLVAKQMGVCVERCIPWLQDWVNESKNPDSPLKIHWLFYDRVKQDTPAVVRVVCQALDLQLADEKLETVHSNLFQGDDNAWLQDVGDEGRDRMWNAMSQEIRDLLSPVP
ncbi:MAG TPA: hypothetical protein VF194_10285 [Ferrovibrio sp.]|uniref:hypothetical protein n=1 Tax=Ferrovibrio sp. TaxID=1917215 RepID=UPI002ED4250D